METIIYPTMDALSYARLHSINTGMDYMGYKNFGYQATEIPIPLAIECPCCNKTMASDLTPIIAVNNTPLKKNDDEETLQDCDVVSIYRCTSCNSLFSIWSHHSVIKNGYNESEEYTTEIKTSYPFDTHTTRFSADISDLSSDFVTVYNQTELAEAHGLDELCGMGYRRALEFLVDAYIRHIKPDANIEASLKLGKKIDKYIDNPKIQILAKKSAWLGNDATHIVKKHPNRDVTDIKKFIKAMTAMIDAEFAYEDADTI